MQFTFNVVEGARAVRTTDIIECVCPCAVSGIPVVDGVTGSDAEVLYKITADPSCPAFGSANPTTIGPWSYTTLQEINIRSRRSPTSAIVDFVYRARAVRGGGAGVSSNWSLSRSPQISHVQTYLSFSGQSLTKVWYKPSTASGTTSEPSGAKDYVAPIAAMRVNSVLTARALLTGTDWRTFKSSIRDIESYLNALAWGGSPRGTWFFVAPTTQTTDFGKSYSVQLDFLENKDGWYPLASFIDSTTGQHPTDSDIEDSFATFPDPGNIITLNGLTRVGEYGEVDFNTYFAFTPDDA